MMRNRMDKKTFTNSGGSIKKAGFISTNKAFTLAEVLITLGIIGVVAALTIPALIQNYKKSVVETRLARFYSVINQAIQRSTIDNGPVIYWEAMQEDYINDGNNRINKDAILWFNKYLRPYLKIVDAKESKTYEKGVEVYFTDGSLMIFSINSIIFYPNAKDFITQEKENYGLDRDRNVCGINYFDFQFYPDRGGILPLYGYSEELLTDERLRNDNDLGCKENVSNERALCTLLIQRNGWKIPKDYPFKF